MNSHSMKSRIRNIQAATGLRYTGALQLWNRIRTMEIPSIEPIVGEQLLLFQKDDDSTIELMVPSGTVVHYQYEIQWVTFFATLLNVEPTFMKIRWLENEVADRSRLAVLGIRLKPKAVVVENGISERLVRELAALNITVFVLRNDGNDDTGFILGELDVMYRTADSTVRFVPFKYYGGVVPPLVEFPDLCVDPCRIPIGSNVDGGVHDWVVSDSVGLLTVDGPTGSGKSHFLNNVVRYVLNFPSRWEVSVIDVGKGNTWNKFSDNANVVGSVNDAIVLFENVSANVGVDSGLRLIVVEEFDGLLESCTDIERGYLLALLNRLSRLGRSIGCFIVVASQSGSVFDSFDGLFNRYSFDDRVAGVGCWNSGDVLVRTFK